MTRVVLAIGGVAAGLYGAELLVSALDPAALIRLPLWLAGATLADDAVLIPLVLAAGWLLTRRSRPGIEATLIRTALIYVGVTTLIALPLLERQGDAANPTVLPRDYRDDWLRLEALIVTVTLTGLIVLRLRRGPHGASEVSEGWFGTGRGPGRRSS